MIRPFWLGSRFEPTLKYISNRVKTVSESANAEALLKCIYVYANTGCRAVSHRDKKTRKFVTVKSVLFAHIVSVLTLT